MANWQNFKTGGGAYTFNTKEKSAPNWDAVAEDITELHYRRDALGMVDCAIRFPFVITLHFDDGDRTFGPHTKGLLTTIPNACMVRDILDDMRKPYIIFNDHLTAPAGQQVQ